MEEQNKDLIKAEERHRANALGSHNLLTSRGCQNIKEVQNKVGRLYRNDPVRSKGSYDLKIPLTNNMEEKCGPVETPRLVHNVDLSPYDVYNTNGSINGCYPNNPYIDRNSYVRDLQEPEVSATDGSVPRSETGRNSARRIPLNGEYPTDNYMPVRAAYIPASEEDIVLPARNDFVDGDEPGTVIDRELETLSQRHAVRPTVRYEAYSDEEVRLRTFRHWRNPYPPISLLVRSGFFYKGGRDTVQCFHCGVILYSWEASDVPDEEHRKHFPECGFLRQKGQDTGIIQTVADLGHSLDTVERAMANLRLSGRQNIDTGMLVDAVFDIEDEDFPEPEFSVADDITPEAEASGGRASTLEPPAEVITQEAGSRHHPLNETPEDEDNHGIAQKARQLEKENEDLRKQTTCRVCLEEPATEVFLPCGHLACCEKCSGQLTDCPFCRKKILRTVHVFLP